MVTTAPARYSGAGPGSGEVVTPTRRKRQIDGTTYLPAWLKDEP